YFDLGSYHRAVPTTVRQAQVWCDRGMVWAYAFNHEEAVRCFERALRLDPDLAAARWGIAYAAGPNYNKAWEAFDTADRTGRWRGPAGNSTPQPAAPPRPSTGS